MQADEQVGLVVVRNCSSRLTGEGNIRFPGQNHRCGEPALQCCAQPSRKTQASGPFPGYRRWSRRTRCRRDLHRWRSRGFRHLLRCWRSAVAAAAAGEAAGRRRRRPSTHFTNEIDEVNAVSFGSGRRECRERHPRCRLPVSVIRPNRRKRRIGRAHPCSPGVRAQDRSPCPSVSGWLDAARFPSEGRPRSAEPARSVRRVSAPSDCAFIASSVVVTFPAKTRRLPGLYRNSSASNPR